MSDIVERLRIWPLRRGYSEMSIRRTMRDAADEIEKLRAALDFYACLDHYQTHNAVAPNVVQFDRGAKARAARGEKK